MGRTLTRGSATGFVAAALLLVLAIFVSPAGAGVYVGGGTVVYKEQGQDPEADSGVVVCNLATGEGIGGGCIPAAPNVNAVQVNDLLRGPQVAFQVCIDLNGDGKCVSQDVGQGQPLDLDKLCKSDPLPVDLVFFSHNDAGHFFNPLGPLPSASTKCPDPNDIKGPGFNGYVVFLCEGVHSTRGSAGGGATPHEHPATIGMINGTMDGTGYGDFCGGLKDQVVKEYVLT